MKPQIILETYQIVIAFFILVAAFWGMIILIIGWDEFKDWVIDGWINCFGRRIKNKK
jgi:hypothetical protein